MLHAILSLLIVAAAPAPSDARFPDSVEVYHCLFDESADKNFDAWPDDWVRHRGAGYPQYINIGICEESSGRSPGSLRFDLNGGPARIDSPPIPVATVYSYVLESRIKTKGLNDDEAFFSIAFFDAKQNLVETLQSAVVRGTNDWSTVRLGPFAPARGESRTAVISLCTRPNGRPDLRGSVWFDDVWLAQVPRVTLTTNRRHNVYLDDQRPEIACRVAGFLDHEPTMQFELVDVFGKQVAHAEKSLRPEAVSSNGEPQIKVDPLTGETRKAFAGSCVWVPPVSELGFYRVRVTMPSRSTVVHQRELAFAVVKSQDKIRSSEYGWAAPRGEQALSLGDLSDLMDICSVGKLKFPIWVGPNDNARIDQLSWFSERLNSEGVEIIGILNDPPRELRSQLGEAEALTAASIFSADSKLWYDSIEPALTRLSLTVRWWQLGSDNDTSFVGYPNLAEKIEQIRRKLARFGQQVNLGVGWRWSNVLPADKNPPWSFVTLSATPALTADELAAHLDTPNPSAAKRYLAMEPLAKDQYSLEDRAADLVHRLVTASIHKADAVFVPDVFDPQHGLISPDGTVGELLLPWRTATHVLAGAQYEGSIQLPNGSSNAIFVRNGSVTMVVWSDVPQRETIYQNDDVKQLDVWGRTLPMTSENDRQSFDVGRSPTFITGLSEPIVRMQMSLAFGNSQLTSLFGRPQSNTISLKNYFSQSVGVRVKLITPDAWRTVPRDMNVKLAAGETQTQPFEITLPYDATSGKQRIRIDCDVNGDRRYQFSVYRSIDVGVDDVKIEVSSHLRDNGDLEVEQRLVNLTDELVSFKCQLFAPDRRRMVSQVLDLGRSGDKKIYRFPDGANLIGKGLWLRAEEIGGQRILNYRFEVEK